MRRIHNLLVTGGAGFIGSAFIRYILQRVHTFSGTIVNLDALTYAGNLQNLKEVEDDPRYIFCQGNITNQKLAEHLILEHQIDTIVHFAAESHVDRSINAPGAFIETNIVGTYRLLEVLRKHPHLHFHHVSTDEVYGSLGDKGLFCESSPYNPSSPYSASKAAADHLVRAYAHTYNLSFCLSNCSNNYGPYQYPEKLIPLMIRNCMERKPLPIYGQGQNVRDWLFVDDHAEALWILLHQGKGTYNIGGGAEWKNLDLVHEITKQISEIQGEDLSSLITFVEDRPGHDLRYAIDCSKIKNELGWRPRHTFEEGLRQTVAWYLTHQEWVQACLL